jgi:hypothetical protein
VSFVATIRVAMRNQIFGTIYCQQRRCWITKRNLLVCSRVKFRVVLLAELEKWREECDQLIVCLDAHEDMYWKSIRKALNLLMDWQ